jgi:hypothetical protein
MVYYTRRVKLDQTANEKYGFPNARVRIIDDLMYRHWDSWSDYSYSHLFTASFDGTAISKEKDIMEGQRFETPGPHDEAELAGALMEVYSHQALRVSLIKHKYRYYLL